jgi:hypothetical protein
MKTAASCPLNRSNACNYTGPERLCLSRWKHIPLFFVFDLSPENYCPAQSLTHHPHYSILQSEIDEFNADLNKFLSQHCTCKIKQIGPHENFQDDLLLVINGFGKFPCIMSVSAASSKDTSLLNKLFSNGKLDSNRGNWKLDFGFSSD